MGTRFLHVFPSFGVGGAQIRFVQFANHFGKRHEHVVVAIDGDFGAEKLLNPGTTIRRERADFPKQRALRHIADIRRLMRDLQPDILATYNWGAIEWALANRWAPIAPRHLHFEDGFGPEEANRQLRRRVWFRRLSLGGSQTKLIVPSLTLKRLAAEVWRIDPAQIEFLANGVDLDRFRPVQEAEMSASRSGSMVTIGTIARLRPEKNIKRLLGAFKRASDEAAVAMRLLVVGDGMERAGLAKHAEELGIAARVTLAGHKEAPERSLWEFDIFALSSDTEQMPISLLEAMACGLPAAATDVGDVANMLPEENARHVRGCREEGELARQLMNLANDPELRRALGNANRRRVESVYDQRRMFERFENLLAM